MKPGRLQEVTIKQEIVDNVTIIRLATALPNTAPISLSQQIKQETDAIIEPLVVVVPKVCVTKRNDDGEDDRNDFSESRLKRPRISDPKSSPSGTTQPQIIQLTAPKPQVTTSTSNAPAAASSTSTSQLKTNQCSYCFKQFRGRYDHLRHLRIHTKEKPYKCDLCDKVFAHKSALKVHTDTHTGQRNWICEICGKASTTRNNWRRHHYLHTGKKPYACKQCDKSFPFNFNLQNHIKCIHPDENTEKFECSQCGRLFCAKYSCKRHEGRCRN